MQEATLPILQKLMEFSSTRHRVLSHNLANVNTPGYRRMDLDFEAVFNEAVQMGPEAVLNLHLEPTEDKTAPIRGDGNSVQMDVELAEMSKNSLTHQMAVEMMRMKMNMSRMAITGRSM